MAVYHQQKHKLIWWLHGIQHGTEYIIQWLWTVPYLKCLCLRYISGGTWSVSLLRPIWTCRIVRHGFQKSTYLFNAHGLREVLPPYSNYVRLFPLFVYPPKKLGYIELNSCHSWETVFKSVVLWWKSAKRIEIGEIFDLYFHVGHIASKAEARFVLLQRVKQAAFTVAFVAYGCFETFQVFVAIVDVPVGLGVRGLWWSNRRFGLNINLRRIESKEKVGIKISISSHCMCSQSYLRYFYIDIGDFLRIFLDLIICRLQNLYAWTFRRTSYLGLFFLDFCLEPTFFAVKLIFCI